MSSLNLGNLDVLRLSLCWHDSDEAPYEEQVAQMAVKLGLRIIKIRIKELVLNYVKSNQVWILITLL